MLVGTLGMLIAGDVKAVLRVGMGALPIIADNNGFKTDGAIAETCGIGGTEIVGIGQLYSLIDIDERCRPCDYWGRSWQWYFYNVEQRV